MKEIKITKCRDCPCLGEYSKDVPTGLSNSLRYFCNHKDNKFPNHPPIYDIETIPDWCRLKDVKYVESKPKGKGFCYRCERRIEFIENGYPRPRYECGDLSFNGHGCYMYSPVRPVILEKNESDERPQFGPWLFSARSHFVRVSDRMKLKIKEVKDGRVLYWNFE